MFPSASPRGTLRVSGKQNSLFPLGPVIKCLISQFQSDCAKILVYYINTNEIQSELFFIKEDNMFFSHVKIAPSGAFRGMI